MNELITTLEKEQMQIGQSDWVNNTYYANNAVLIAESKDGLQKLVEFNKLCKLFNMKSKTMTTIVELYH